MITVTKNMMAQATEICMKRHPDRPPTVDEIAAEVRIIIKKTLTPQRKKFLQDTLKEMRQEYGDSMGDFGTGLDS